MQYIQQEKSIWWVAGGWLGGWFFQEILPLRGSILQAGTCKILSFAENPRWSQVGQLFIAEEVIEVDQLEEQKNGGHLGRSTQRHK